MKLIKSIKKVEKKARRFSNRVNQSKFVKDVRLADESIKMAVRHPAKKINTPAARRYERKSREIGKTLFGDRFDKRTF